MSGYNGKVKKSGKKGGREFHADLSEEGIRYFWRETGYPPDEKMGSEDIVYSLSHNVDSPKVENMLSPKNDDKSGEDAVYYRKATYDEFLTALSFYSKRRNIVILLAAFTWFFLVPGIIALIIYFCTRKDRVTVVYHTDAFFDSNYKIVTDSFAGLVSASKLWEVMGTHTTTAYEQKRNAGVSTVVDSKRAVSAVKIHPFFLQKGFRCVQINADGKTAYFLPEHVLIGNNGGRFKAVGYGDTYISVSYEEFVETSDVPQDADVIGYRWEKINKDGSRDRRFKDNRQLPVCRYGVARLSFGRTGINYRIYCSNWHATERLTGCEAAFLRISGAAMRTYGRMDMPAYCRRHTAL